MLHASGYTGPCAEEGPSPPSSLPRPRTLLCVLTAPSSIILVTAESHKNSPTRRTDEKTVAARKAHLIKHQRQTNMGAKKETDSPREQLHFLGLNSIESQQIFQQSFYLRRLARRSISAPCVFFCPTLNSEVSSVVIVSTLDSQ